MNLYSHLTAGHPLVRLVSVTCLLLSGWSAQAAPAIVSTVPVNMATGVSPTAPVVFTFSEAMNPSATAATFMDLATYQFLPALAVWSGGNTVLTCSPVPSWPANHMIVWSVEGENPGGVLLGGGAGGVFTPGATSTSCDPGIPMLSFTVSKGALYEQTSAGAPTQNPGSPYCFLACMSLPCPRNATNVTLRLPGGGTPSMNLSQLPGHLTLLDCGVAAPVDMIFPAGDYIFNIKAVSSNQSVTVNFPESLIQPPAPHLTNYLAAQAINPDQPFVLAWDPFPGGTAADCIHMEIYGGVFQTPALGMAGALNGTAKAVVIPAGTFQANHQYSGCVTFYHYQLLTNGASHVSLAYRASATEFDLSTGAGSGFCPVITNAGWAGAGTFKFEVACPINQPLVAEWRANPSAGQWQRLCTTNSGVTQRVQFTDPIAGANSRQFYRVRTGL